MQKRQHRWGFLSWRHPQGPAAAAVTQAPEAHSSRPPSEVDNTNEF